MKVLFIGGTGFISAAASRAAISAGHELYLLSRGTRVPDMPGAHPLIVDIRQPEEAAAALEGLDFDVVVDWLVFSAEDAERDIRLFRGRTKQHIMISSASAYQKPPEHYLIRETTPLLNPFWDYARGKIDAERRFMQAHRDEGFPVTIVRPSMTYDTNLPIAIGGWGTYTLADRLAKGKPVIVHGDGTSLWVLTHADDLAQGLIGLFGNERALGEAFHITSDEVLTWDQIYFGIADALGVEAQIVHVPSDLIERLAPKEAGSLSGDKAHSVVFDNGKIKEFVPGFAAKVPFSRGIRRTLDWFAADESRRVVDEAVNGEVDSILAGYARIGPSTPRVV